MIWLAPEFGCVEVKRRQMFGASTDPQVELGRQMARRSEEFYWAHRP